MTPDQWKRLRSIAGELLLAPEEERRERVGALCNGDEELEAQVMELLDEPEGSFLEPPPFDLGAVHAWDLVPGASLGEFEIIEEIGRGGMGVVYRAQQVLLDREVALKVMAVRNAQPSQQTRRFALEAVTAARLDHPNIVRVVSAGEADGYRYLAMELVIGSDLHSLLEDARGDQRSAHGGLPSHSDPGRTRAIAELVREIANALHFAHGHGIVHRDIKPQNVLVDKSGKGYVADFGLAKDLGIAGISATGQMMGTPYYMSPEQALLLDSPVDHRSDVFSLGSTLYEALTLEKPFEGSSVQGVLQAITHVEPRSPRLSNPRIHPDLELICLKALEKEPCDRFPDAAAMAAELGRFLAHEPLAIKPVPRLVRAGRRIWRHRLVASLALGLLGALALSPILVGRVRAAGLEQRVELAEQQLSSSDDGEWVAARQAALRLAGEELDGDLRDRVDGLHRACRDRAEQLRLRAEELRNEAQGLSLSSDLSTQDERLNEAHRMLLVADRLSPQEENARTAQGYLSPRVFVQSDRANVRLSIQSIDPVSGVISMPEMHGAVSHEGIPIGRGLYRFLLSCPGEATLEFTRLVLHRGQELRLTPRFRSVEEIVGNMQLISAASVTLEGLDERPVQPMQIDGFWIDSCEVSIGDFRRFMADTGHPGPQQWRVPSLAEPFREVFMRLEGADGVPEGPFDDLPISGVSWAEAVAYAEWAGKRLPTVFEWDLAARGIERRAYPWTTAKSLAPGSVFSFANLADATKPRSSPGNESPTSYFLRRVRPVLDLPQGRTPQGLYNMLGNVKELTETPRVGWSIAKPGVGRLPAPDFSTFHIRGASFETPHIVQNQLVTLSMSDGKLVNSANLAVGFRCARSTNHR